MNKYDDYQERLPHLDTVLCGQTERGEAKERLVETVLNDYRNQVIEMCRREDSYVQDDANTWVFRPSKVSGEMTEYELRFIADELKARNAEQLT